jgi:cobalt-zinc-cadmium efflux system outer membrane protein
MSDEQVRRAVVVLVLAATVAHAEDATPVRLADVLAAAARAPAVQVGRHEVDAAAALVDAAGAWPSPGLRVETNRLTARLVAGVTLPLPLFGTVGAARRVAAAQRDAVRAEVLVEHRDIVRAAVTAWIALARADAEVIAATTAESQAQELEKIAQGRLASGDGSDVDVTTSHAAHARAALAITTARHAEEAASAELAGILGWDPTRPLVATGDLPGGQATTVESLRTQLRAHPTHALAERRVAAADATIVEARRQYWPSVAVEAQVSAHDPTQPGTDVLVALSLEVPVFAHVGDRVRSARATAGAERARELVTDAQLDAGLVAAYRRWQSAAEQLAALESTIVPAQQKAQTLAHQAYREGALNLAAVLQTDRDLAAVRAEVITARTDLAAAWVSLQDAAGNDLGGAHAP